MSHTPVIVGLTGGIASGKSTVSNMLRELGVHIIDADVVAREVVAPGAPALDDIREAFGDGVIAADGSLDRAALGDLVFSNPEARATLNGITHPRIGQAMWAKAEAAGESGHTWVVYDAALIVENGLHHILDATIVVACPREMQIDRVVARDDLSREDATARVDSQLPLADKVAVADYVVDNDATLDETRARVSALHALIAERIAESGSAKPAAD